jgi:arsenical pump membrane protein
MISTPQTLAVWTIAVLATAGVIARPFKWPEAVWAVAGATLLVGAGLLSLSSGWRAIGKGLDVYLFLTGMMLLSEVARREGLFDWVAAVAVNLSSGSPKRLFPLIYAAGVLVTAFLSNDATAVVLTPAVYAATKKAKADPLPYLFICAFIANAASFVLPISNPANIVLYASHTPPLGQWLASFAVPSALSIIATYAALRWSQRAALRAPCESRVEQPRLTVGGRTAMIGIAATAIGLLVVSALDRPLGAPTFILGLGTAIVVLARDRTAIRPVVRGVSWGVLPLVAGLFVLVEAVDQTGLAAALTGLLNAGVKESLTGTAAAAGAGLALISNLMNNLPAGLVASGVIAQAHPPRAIVDALLVGVDLGPNLSITGSLATILWLTAIRREGQSVGFWRFLKVGALVMPPALLLALAGRLLLGAIG